MSVASSPGSRGVARALLTAVGCAALAAADPAGAAPTYARYIVVGAGPAGLQMGACKQDQRLGLRDGGTRRLQPWVAALLLVAASRSSPGASGGAGAPGTGLLTRPPSQPSPEAHPMA